jgi:hypothetical protein
MNVMILTMERHGCSWLGALIIEVHKQVYDEIVPMNYECSRIIATDPKYLLPRGYCSVYYVSPKWLLEREYDKIIILQKDLDLLKTDMCYYYYPEKTKEEVFEEFTEFEPQIDFYYDLIFDESVKDDPRVHWVYLDDLNFYTVATCSLLFDFLEFPRKRPVILPVNRWDRDFRMSGTILRKGHGTDIYIKKMMKQTKTQVRSGLVDIDYAQYVNTPQLNPYRLSPEEFEIQNRRVFRIRPEPEPDVLKYLGLI